MEEKNNKRPFRQRLAMDLPLELHRELKVRAAKRNITITKYVMALLIDQLKKERMYD